MADKATGSTSASVFLDEIKASMGGSLNYEPADTTQKWVFAEQSVNSNANLLTASNDTIDDGTAIAVGDTYKWICIKNMSSTSTDGIGLSMDGGDPSSISLADGIYLGAGEMVILKPINLTVELLHAASVTMDGTYGYPSATNSSAVTVQVAAIIDTDVG